MRQVSTYKFVYRLEKGDVVYINGFPYEYMGDEEIGGNTDYRIIDNIKKASVTEEESQKAFTSLENYYHPTPGVLPFNPGVRFGEGCCTGMGGGSYGSST